MKTNIAFVMALLLASACSKPSITAHKDGEKTRDGRIVGTIALADNNKANLYKIDKGYALKANLDNAPEDERKGDFVVSRNKEYKWFAGLQWRFAF